MKLIDLFVKIANGEKIPDIIEFHGRIFRKNGKEYNYYCAEEEKILEEFFIFEELNDEVEIIEEDKEIEEIERHMISQNYVIEDEKAPMKERMGVIRELIYKNSTEINIVKDKINELVRELNELKKGK